MFNWSLGNKTDLLRGLKMDPEDKTQRRERIAYRVCNTIRSKVIDECRKWTVRGFILALKTVIVKLLMVLQLVF